jgi:hypothetical protein
MHENCLLIVDENLKCVFKVKEIANIQIRILALEKSSNAYSGLKCDLLDFIFKASLHEYGRQLLLEHFDSKKYQI